MEIKIEKNIPIPPRCQSGLAKTLHQMEVGDSFTVPLRLRSLVARTAKRLEVKIKTQSTDTETIRVWRTE